MPRRRIAWTARNIDKLNRVIQILNDLHEYIPLTLRQIYYQLVGVGYIENKVSEYTMLSILLKWARIDGYIPWDCIEDRIRAYHDLTGWTNCEEFKNASFEYFLSGYRRDLLQSQKKYLEIWIEKDALSTIFRKVAAPFCVSVVICRGFSSVSFLNEYKIRLLNHQDKKPVLLYFGDFDPSGVEMLESMETTLETDLNVSGIEFKRIALMKKDIEKYNLPHSPDALKKTDTRAKKHVIKYGELAVELDALPPDILINKITDGIMNELDIDLYNDEVKKNVVEIDKLNSIKQKVGEMIQGAIN